MPTQAPPPTLAGEPSLSSAGAVAIIPARYASRRLPGKALVDIDGLPMVVRVMARAQRARRISRVIVATDDDRILDAVRAHGGEAMLTASSHRSGTDRICEVTERLSLSGVVVNVQGDEPLIEPAVIDALVEAMQRGVAVATVAAPLDGDPADPACVKVVTDADGRALYFSRAPIPFGGPYRQHIGLYAFRPDALARFASLPRGRLERRESLEQLRFLEAGMTIAVVDVEGAAPSVDTPADLARVRALFSSSRPLG